jgi:hypothetical protein
MKQLFILFISIFLIEKAYTQQTCIIELNCVENRYEMRIPKRKNHRQHRFPQKITYMFKAQLKKKDSTTLAFIQLDRAYGLLRDFEENNRFHRLKFDTDEKNEQKRFISNFLKTTLKNGLIIEVDQSGNVLNENSLNLYTPFFDDSLQAIYGADKTWLDSKLIYVKYDLANAVSQIVATQSYTAIHQKDTLVPYAPLQNTTIDTSIGIYYNTRLFSRPRLKFEQFSYNVKDKISTDTLVVTARTDSGYRIVQRKKSVQKHELNIINTNPRYETQTETNTDFTADKQLLLINYSSEAMTKIKVYEDREFIYSLINIKVTWL